MDKKHTQTKLRTVVASGRGGWEAQECDWRDQRGFYHQWFLSFQKKVDTSLFIFAHSEKWIHRMLYTIPYSFL